MYMKISGVVTWKPTADLLRGVTPKMLPYVVGTMMTRLAQDGQAQVRKQLPVNFDRPTSFTVRGVFVGKVERGSLERTVYFPDSQQQAGRGEREYIRPGALGTPRRSMKRTEVLLQRGGYLPPGWVTTPGKGAKLDRHGNISGAAYKQMINVLQLKKMESPNARDVYQKSQKRAGKLGVASEFFAVTPGSNKLAKGGGWLPPGVWRHMPGRKLTQILKFVSKASYQPRMDITNEVQDGIKPMLDQRWAEAASAIKIRFARPR